MIKGRYRSPLKHSAKMKNFGSSCWTFPSDATEIQLNCGGLKRLLSQPVRCWAVNVHHVESNSYQLAQMWWLYHLDEMLMTSKRPAGNHHSFWLWDWWFHCAGFAVISQWILLEGMCIHFMFNLWAELLMRGVLLSNPCSRETDAPTLFYLQVTKASSLHLHKKVTTSRIRGM